MTSAAKIISRQFQSGGGGSASSQATAALLPRWRAARAKTKANFTGYNGAKLLLLGHSHMAGSGASNSSGYNSNGRLKSLPTALQRMFAFGLMPANSNNQIGFGNTSTWAAFDTRWVVSGWTYNLLNQSIGGRMTSTTDAATLSFTPTSPVTTFEVWYAVNSSRGQMNVRVDAGADTLVDAANVTPSIGKYVVSVSAANHTLNITKVGTLPVDILAVFAYHNALTTGFNDEVQIIQAGHSGAKADTYAGSANPWDGINQILQVAPDCTYIQLSINDWVAGTTLASYKANIQLLIDAAKVSGDVILSTDCPSDPATVPAATQALYVQAIKELASANKCVVYDLYGRLQSYAVAQSSGMMADNLHGNSLYYADAAQGLYNILSQ